MLALAAFACPTNATDISTAQIDTARTMAYGSEIYLTTANVNGSHFGKLFSRTVDGAIFAQPLFLQGMTISGKKVNVVYVATSHNRVYAFDADKAKPDSALWSVSLGQYDNSDPTGWVTGMGIISTPVISRASGVMFVVAATLAGGSRVFKLHALDLVTGAEKLGGPVVVSGSVSPSNAGDAVNGTLSFNASHHVQRTGLALAGNNVVFAFAADRDIAPYHGWVFSYSATTLQATGIFNAAHNNPDTNGTGSGIWQSGRAPAVDSTGAVYFETGNGDWDGITEFGESFLKLNGTSALALTDWFTPSAWSDLNIVDYDLSSTGTTLIPGTNLVFGGSKSGTIYLLSTNHLGQTLMDSGAVQMFTATSGCQMPYTFQGCAQIMGQVFWSTAPVPTLYVWAVHDVLRSYPFSNGQFMTATGSVGTRSANYPGGVLSLSSYLGTSGTGILWAITSNATNDGGDYFGPGNVWPATLRAFDAATPSIELWNSGQNPIRDSVGTMASFTPPIAVNGKVYVPTFSNQLVVYGLLNGPVTGDVNGDSTVTCADVAIVKASYGLSSGQQGFDLRADVNGDGIVNMLDLSTVTKSLSRGTVCP